MLEIETWGGAFAVIISEKAVESHLFITVRLTI